MSARSARRVLAAMALLTAAAVGAGEGQAQVAPVDGQRDCHTVRNCRFTPGGSFRGCISAYTCRTCRPVRTSCPGLKGRVCQELRCTWGG